jgi:hypothetical protein
VAALYEQLGIGDETCVDFFEGGHEIHGTVSFSFLEQKLLPEMAIWRAFAVLVPLVLRNMRASGY